MPFELLRLEADGQVTPFRSVMRHAAVTRQLGSDDGAVFAIDTNTLEVVAVSPGFPDDSIVGLPLADVRSRFGSSPLDAENRPPSSGGAHRARRTRRDDARLAGTAEAAGQLALLVAFVAGAVTPVLAMAADENNEWILLIGLVVVLVVASLGVLLRVGGATLRRSLDR